MCIELILLSINFLLLTNSIILDNIDGQVYAFYILVVAAAESAIGLAILVIIFRNSGTVSIKKMNDLKG